MNNHTKNNIYLTFDDGPTPEVTPWVLSLLNQYHLHATFFCTGTHVAQYTDLFRQILFNGHAVGNHGFEHLNGWKTPLHKYIQNAKQGEKIIPTSLFRPPYGKITPLQWLYLHKKVNLVFWNYLSKDYLPLEKNSLFLENLKKHTVNHSVIVFHDSVKAFPVLQKFLEEYFIWLQATNFESHIIT